MGYGLPMSLPVCIGSNRQRTIHRRRRWRLPIQYPGSETARRLNLPVKLFVLNNDGYASIRASQQAYFAPRR